MVYVHSNSINFIYTSAYKCRETLHFSCNIVKPTLVKYEIHLRVNNPRNMFNFISKRFCDGYVLTEYTETH